MPFNDYTTFGYDNGRDVYNPNSAAITPASVAGLHLAWQTALDGGFDYATQTQPVLATEISGHAGVLFVGGSAGNVYAYDALSGALIWTRKLGTMQYTCGGTSALGVGGTGRLRSGDAFALRRGELEYGARHLRRKYALSPRRGHR